MEWGHVMNSDLLWFTLSRTTMSVQFNSCFCNIFSIVGPTLWFAAITFTTVHFIAIKPLNHH